MAITLTGSAGCQFSITKVDTANAIGTIAGITYQDETAIRSVTFTNASLVAAMSGVVAASAGTQIDLYALNTSGALYLAQGTAPIVFQTILTIVIHNKHASSTIAVAPGATNSFLAASTLITIPAGGAAQLTYTTAATVSSTVRNILLTSSSGTADCEVYVLGGA
jgi:hypothetical protein